jgi:hypothetical protein
VAEMRVRVAEKFDSFKDLPDAIARICTQQRYTKTIISGTSQREDLAMPDYDDPIYI